MLMQKHGGKDGVGFTKRTSGSYGAEGCSGLATATEHLETRLLLSGFQGVEFDLGRGQVVCLPLDLVAMASLS